MAVTYDPTLTDNISKVRFRIGDTIEDAGALPDGKNIADAEITALVTFEGSWQRATAACFEKLAAAWAGKANLSASNGGNAQSWQYQSVMKSFQDLAKKWRDEYGSVGTDQDPDSGETAPSIEIGVMGGGFQATW